MRSKRKALSKEEKKLLKKKKLEDPYGIDDMSDEEFLEKKNKLVKGGISRISGGMILLILIIIFLIMYWSKIFYT